MPYINTFWDCIASTPPRFFPLQRLPYLTCPGASKSAPSLFSGIRTDLGIIIFIIFFPRMRKRCVGSAHRRDRGVAKPYLSPSSLFPRVSILLDVCQTAKPPKGAGGWGLKIANDVTCRPIPALQAGLAQLYPVPPHHWCCNLFDNTCFKFINKL